MRTSSKWRGALASAASAAVLVAVPLVAAQPAHAQSTCTGYPATVCLTVRPVTVPAGGTLTFSASGFAPGQPVTAVLLSREVVLGRFTADGTGTLTEETVTIPPRTKPGYHTFKLIAHDPERTLSALIKVVGEAGKPDHRGSDGGSQGHGGRASKDGSGRHDRNLQLPSLARTGSDHALALVGAAGALVTGGGGTLLVARRRRSS
ncbi:hypothetical protein [Streptomyces chiangmaiensis]|uniref:Gram-positive cocci surface proteins LPxTG domain-containing protein n=1 Tax=Streptomyces chiangmaiensis TaxID=766497 RepID=A0ABU7FMH2_9ACTN|nr:hypothetical protein [Streptomyces chiangmaiensis]MED7825302.1 hypothetical protein [Streptomyces chiangmaiensis]